MVTRATSASLTQAEAEVLRRWDLGHGTRRIARESGIHPSVVARTVSWTSEHETRAMHANIRTGSARLLAAIQREGMAA